MLKINVVDGYLLLTVNNVDAVHGNPVLRWRYLRSKIVSAKVTEEEVLRFPLSMASALE